MKPILLLVACAGLMSLGWPSTASGPVPTTALALQESEDHRLREIEKLSRQLAQAQEQNLELQRHWVEQQVTMENQRKEMEGLRQQLQARLVQLEAAKKAQDDLHARLQEFANVQNQFEQKLSTHIFTPKWAPAAELIDSANNALGATVFFYAATAQSERPQRVPRERFTALHSSNQIIITDFPQGISRSIEFLQRVDQSIGEARSSNEPAPSVRREPPQILVRGWLVGPKQVHGEALQALPSGLETGLKSLVPQYDFGSLAHSITRSPAAGRLSFDTAPPDLSMDGPSIERWQVEMRLDTYDPTTKQLKLERFETNLQYKGGANEQMTTSLAITESEYAVVGSVRGGQSYVVLSFQVL